MMAIDFTPDVEEPKAGKIDFTPDPVEAVPARRTDDLSRNIGPLGLPYGQQPSRADYDRGMSRMTRIFLESIGGLPQAIGETIARGANVLQRQQITPPSEGLQTQLQRAGYPQDVGGLEKASSIVGSIGVGAAADPLSRAVQTAVQRAPAAFQTAKQVARNAKQSTAKELLDEGIPLLPSQAEGGPAALLSQGLGSTAHTASAAQKKAQPVLQALAARETGVAPTDLSKEALDAAAQVHIREGYEPIKRLGNIYFGVPATGTRPQTHPYQRALDSIRNKYGTIDQGRQLRSRIAQMRTTSEPAETVLERIGQVRADAKDAFMDNKYNYGKALRELANAMEDQVERNLQSAPAGRRLLAGYRSAREALAKNYAVQEMLVDPTTGIIDTTKAAKLYEHGEPLTGGLLTIAKAGSKMFAQATKPPVEGKIPFNMGDVGFTGGMGGIGALAFGGPMGAAVALGAPFLRAGARAATLSPSMQRSLARGLMAKEPSALAPTIQRGMVAAPFPLFSQGDE